MKNNKQNTKQILSVFVELSKHIPPYLTSKVATELRKSDPDIKLNARTFSLWSQTASMLYCHLAHCLSLNDVCDSLNFHRAELNSLRNATAPCRNTLSHANRTRDSRFIQKVFWAQLEHLQQAQPEFLQDGARRYFRLPRHIKRAVRAIDSTPISQKQYSESLRLIEAQVKADDGEIKTMRFISNNMTWAASSICDLYRCRWAIEIFFKEIKQTLQIKTFLGFNQNAIEWQIWTAMLTYLILRYVAFMSKWKGSFKHFIMRIPQQALEMKPSRRAMWRFPRHLSL